MEKVREATINGKLGYCSKVATAKKNPNAKVKDVKVICVYTYNYRDKKDVIRIRNELRSIGITWKIPYKSDYDTITNKKKWKSKYYL